MTRSAIPAPPLSPDQIDTIGMPATGANPKTVLMRRGETWTIKEAADYAGRDNQTMRRWCRRYGICRQTGPGAPIEVSRPGLEMILHGDLEALEYLRAGNRNHPSVLRFLEFVGVNP